MAPRRRKLTAAQKKAVWAEPESNAGAGWWTPGRECARPAIDIEINYAERGRTKPLDFEDGE